MRLITWNANSLRARQERVRLLLERHAPDVVCLQETKIEDHEFPELEYRAAGYACAAWGQRAYNGVALLARAPIGDVVRGFGDGGDDTQARFIGARVAGMRVFCAYVPNGQAPGTEKMAYKLDWLWRLRRFLDQKCDPAEPLVLCGDMNVAPEDRDVHDPALWRGSIMCTDEERAALRRVQEWGLHDAFRAHRPEGGLYSWWDYRMSAFKKGRGLRIDHVFVTAPLLPRTTGASIDRDERAAANPSDHAPVLLELAGAPDA
jgi:exodeoxyribonuclease-3